MKKIEQQLTRRVVDLTRLLSKDIHWDEIAQSLAHINRWCGRVGRASVAEHSVHMYDFFLHDGTLSRALRLHALLHDAAEAFIGDTPGPVKATLPSLIDLERSILRAVHLKAGIQPTSEQTRAVERIDRIAGRVEAETFFPSLDERVWDRLGAWPADWSRKAFRPRRWSPRRARKEFLKRLQREGVI